MVAITVILAAVIGTFVLGLGDQVQSTTPQASFDFESSNMNGNDDASPGDDQVTITHESGDSLTQSDISVRIASTTIYSGGSAENSADVTGWSTGDSIGAGDQLVFTENADVAFSGENTVRVIYNNPDSDSSSTLATQTYDFDGTS